MTDGSRLLTYLARAYALTQAIPTDHPLVQDALVRAAEAVDASGSIRVGLTLDGFIGPEGPVDDPHGEVARLAGALFGAGVRALVLSGDLDREGLEGVLRALRSGTAEEVRQRLRDLSPESETPEQEGPAQPAEAEDEAAGVPQDVPVPVGELAPAALAEPAPEARPFPPSASLSGIARRIAELFEELETDLAVEREARPTEVRDPDPTELMSPQEAFQAAGLEGVVTIVTEGEDEEPLPSDARLVVRRLLDAHGDGRERVLAAIQGRAREDAGAAHALADALAAALADATERSARRACIDALVAIGDPGRRMGERMLEDSRWFVVRNGVSIVAETGGPDDVPLVLAALSHPDSRVRREGALALARLGGARAKELVTDLLTDAAPEVRVAAARAVGALRPPEALEPVLKHLDAESDPEVEEQLVRALGALGNPQAIQAVARRAEATFFRRPGPSLRLAAYRALAAIGSPEAIDILKGGQEDRDPGVRAEVGALLKDLGAESGSDEDKNGP
jgi:HEAT repeat protein